MRTARITRFTDITVSDEPGNVISRTLRARVTGAPELRTPAGRDPITPRHVWATYSRSTGETHSITVSGYRSAALDRQDVQRKVSTDAVPAWLRTLLDTHRPGAR